MLTNTVKINIMLETKSFHDHCHLVSSAKAFFDSAPTPIVFMFYQNLCLCQRQSVGILKRIPTNL